MLLKLSSRKFNFICQCCSILWAIHALKNFDKKLKDRNYLLYFLWNCFFKIFCKVISYLSWPEIVHYNCSLHYITMWLCQKKLLKKFPACRMKIFLSTASLETMAVLATNGLFWQQNIMQDRKSFITKSKLTIFW